VLENLTCDVLDLFENTQHEFFLDYQFEEKKYSRVLDMIVAEPLPALLDKESMILQFLVKIRWEASSGEVLLLNSIEEIVN